MKSAKKILCVLLAAFMLMGTFVLSAGAAGTIACGAATVSASVLNIRSGAGTNNSIVGTVNNGSTVIVLEKTSEGWYKINYNGTTGYVCTDYLKNFSEDCSLNLTGKVNGTDVRYRTSAGTSGSIIGIIPYGTSVAVSAISNGWYKVSYNGNTGYMRSDYITITGGASAGTQTSTSASDTSTGENGKVNADYVNFRTGPSTSYSVIRMLNSGTAVTVLGESNGWSQITYNGTSGYMSSQYITVGSSTSTSSSSTASSSTSTSEISVEEMNESGSVSGDYVNFRTGPSTNYSVIATLAKGTQVSVIGKTSGWYKIKYNGSTGYMSADYVKIGSSTTESTTTLGEQIAAYAKQFVGYNYVYGGASPSQGFDCSGLMYYVYGQFGYSLSRGAQGQYNNNGKYVSKSDLQPGDLVFFSSDGFASVTHVGMYIGNNKFVHASGSKVGVIISDLTSSYYLSVYYGAKRIV